MIDGLQIVVESAEADVLFSQMMQVSVRTLSCLDIIPTPLTLLSSHASNGTCVGVADCDHTDCFSRQGAFTTSHNSVKSKVHI
jgi:hypothetical protein